MTNHIKFHIPTQSANLGFKASDTPWPNLYASHPVETQLGPTSLLPGGRSYSTLLATPHTHLKSSSLGRAPGGESESVRTAKLYLPSESIQKLAGPNSDVHGLPIDRTAQ